MEQEKKLPIPPYIAYKTLRNFLDRFALGVPGRIDRSLMGNMSGAAQSQITVSLKYLGLTDDHGHPGDAMVKLVRAEGEVRQKVWSDILRDSYPFLFRDGFNLQTVTAKLLREQFEKTAATGETLNRCIAFFITALKDAGIAVSPFLKEPRKPRGSSSAPKGRGSKEKEKPLNSQQKSMESTERERGNDQKIPAQDSLLLWGLFSRLPKPGTAWAKAERDQWTATLNNVLAMEYKES